ncbi:MAG: GGDEF domain-containing protein [Devosia sp.]
MSGRLILWRRAAAVTAIIGACIALLVTGPLAVLGLAGAIVAVVAIYLLPSAASVSYEDPDNLAPQQEGAPILDEPTFLRRLDAAIAFGGGALLVIHPSKFVADAASENAGSVDAQSRLLIAQTVQQSVRQDDIVGYDGSGDLVVFLRGAHQDRSEEIADRICGVVRNTIFLGENAAIAEIGVAIGGTLVNQSAEQDPIWHKAKTNLLIAKELGPNRYAIAA